MFPAIHNSVQIQYQQAHVIIIVNRNSDIIDVQFRYHRYAIQLSSICSSCPEFPMLSIIHSLSISTSRKLIKVELDYTSVKLYLIIHLCQIIHLISLVIRYTHQQQNCLLAGKGAFARKKRILGLVFLTH